MQKSNDTQSALVQRIRHQPRARRLRVIRTTQLSPTSRQVVLTGSDLEPDFPFLRMAPTDHVKVVLPDPHSGEIRLAGDPGQPDPSRILRDYTIRHLDREARELTLNFTLHGHGPASRWAERADEGAELGVLGPRGSQVYPDHFPEYLLVADDTGLAAAERFLEELPAEAAIQVVAIVGGQESVRPLAGGRTDRVLWLPLGGLAPASASAAIVEAVAGLSLHDNTFVWAAGEARAMRDLRDHLVGWRGLDGDRVATRGYWRAEEE